MPDRRYALRASAEYVLMSQKQSLDADLLAAVPDADAVRSLYERHADAVFRFAVRRCRSPEAHHDACARASRSTNGRREPAARVWPPALKPRSRTASGCNIVGISTRR